MDKRKLRKRIEYALRVFYRKRIIYSRKYKPAVLVFSFTHKGTKYARVAFDNRRIYADKIPMVDIPFKDITAIKLVYSKAEKWLWSLIGVKAQNKNIPIQKLKTGGNKNK